jgi:hypothetical protein
VDYRNACKSAIERGIIVNTIFCGTRGKGIAGMWEDGARLADGSYMSIDQNAEIIHIEAPQDEEIARLNEELNDTYIPYGTEGEAKQNMQQEQDANAAAVSPAILGDRVATKASQAYANAAWDLVDAIKDGLVNLEEVADDDLPAEMQSMNQAQRQAHVQSNQQRRSKLQSRIRDLSEQRRKFVAEKRKEQAEAGQTTLDEAVIKAVREQVARKNYNAEKP